jgi:tetratricopeptide (TPR) repeat protein
MRAGAGWLAVLVGILVLGGCGGGDAAAGRVVLGEEADPLPPAVRAQIDSANEAYRAGDLDAARLHYGRSTELDPTIFAGWYGLAMVADAVGDADAARATRARAQQIAGEAGEVAPHPGAGAHPPMMPGSPHGELPAGTTHPAPAAAPRAY